MIPTFQHFSLSLLILFCTGPFFGFQLFYYKVDVGLWLLLLPQKTSNKFSQIFELLGELEGLDETPPFKSNPFFKRLPMVGFEQFFWGKKTTNCVMCPLGWRMIFPGARHGCVQCLWRNYVSHNNGGWGFVGRQHRSKYGKLFFFV